MTENQKMKDDAEEENGSDFFEDEADSEDEGDEEEREGAGAKRENSPSGGAGKGKKKKKKRYLSRVMYFRATGRRLIHHTVCLIQGGQEIFKDEELCRRTTELLKEQAKYKKVALFCFGLFPDRCEMVLRSPASISHSDFVRDFKGAVNRSVKGETATDSVWERDFVDNMLLHRGAFEDAQAEVMGRAVKSGLVKKGENYPWAEQFSIAPKFYKKSPIKIPKNVHPKDEYTEEERRAAEQRKKERQAAREVAEA